jgi:transcriptional regulator with XRE-family HTH domain
MTPVAEWLRTTRERHGLTQERFLEALASETGWAPHRPNYSRYESGKSTPQPDTLAKFVAFWQTRGEPVLSDNDRLIAALAAQTDAIRELVARLDVLPELVRSVETMDLHATDERQAIADGIGMVALALANRTHAGSEEGSAAVSDVGSRR